MRDREDHCAMEIESEMGGLSLPEPERVQKPKRKWDSDVEFMWEEKAVLVLHICREQLARNYPEGCQVVPTSFFDLANMCEAGSSSAVREQSIGSSNKTFDDSMNDVGSVFKGGLHISELHQPRKGDLELSDEDKVRALHMVRCNDEESKVGLGPAFTELTPNELRSLESSINVISLKIIESDLGYPINVFGTVLARDEVDYKCVYLFQRDMENPQLINSPNEVLNLTGPYGGLVVSGVMFF